MTTYLPLTAAPVSNLDTEPAPRSNWECVNSNPTPRYEASYVWTLNDLPIDEYQFIRLPQPLNIRIRRLDIAAIASRTNLIDDCDIRVGVSDGATINWGTGRPLTPDWTAYSSYWANNPFTAAPWLAADLSALNDYRSTLQLFSNGLNTEAHCTQLVTTISFTILAEFISDMVSFPSDTIYLDQDFSILLELPNPTLVFFSTFSILYRAPDGSTGTLDAIFVDDSFLLATLPANLNSQLGKWLFKPVAILPGNQIIEGTFKQFNAISRWT